MRRRMSQARGCLLPYSLFLILFEKFQQACHGPGTVANLVFLLSTHLGKGAAVAFCGHKYRVVAEATVSAGLLRDMARHLAGKLAHAAVGTGQSYDGTEARRAVRFARQLLQQLGYVVFGPALGA